VRVRNYRVVTRYYGPTDTKGSYITVRRDGGRVARIPYDHAASNAHESAVEQAFERWGLRIDGYGFTDTARGGRGNVYHVTVEG
jgi:hypothetical protein